MSSNVPPPPMREESSYEEWKKEIVIWQLVTPLPAKKQGPAILLSLQGKARELCLEMDTSDITTDKGVDAVMAKLDSLFLQDSEHLAFEAYERFEKYSRSPGMSLDDYLFEFDRLYEKVKKHGMLLPEGVLAYRLLKSASLTDAEEKLARATVEALTFKDMRSILKKITGQTAKSNVSGISVTAEAFECTAKPSPEANVQSPEYTLYSQSGRKNWRNNASMKPRFGSSRREEKPDWKTAEESKGGPKLNPTDRWGKVSRCAICDSKYHWVAKCPHKSVSAEKDEVVHVTLFANEESTPENFCFGTAILDSGCTSSVCGKEWYDCFVDGLDDVAKDSVKESTSTRKFKFGGGKVSSSLKQVALPCSIASTKVVIQCDVVNDNIPLLLSKRAMKRAKTKIDFETDKIQMLGKEVFPHVNSSGHYCITLGPSASEVHLTTAEESADRIASKLHRQFAHASARQISALTKKAGTHSDAVDSELLKVEQTCEICKRFKKPHPRPSVGLPMASEFNETVGMDLKQIDGTIVLHMVDLATRYSAATVVSDKTPEKIIEGVFTKWISIFGCPQRFLTDNGGEFVNVHFTSMAENCNIRMMTTSAESPWSNGIVERHNSILADKVRRISADVGCNHEIAVSWAIAARNSLDNHNGFSPNQLVFGRNPMFPNNYNNDVPAMEGKSSCEIVARNLNAMNEARRSFIENESSERIRRALRRNAYEDEYVEAGDCVYYKRKERVEWHGPGRVIGCEGSQVVIKHGEQIIRVHTARVQKSTICSTVQLSENGRNCSTGIEDAQGSSQNLGMQKKHLLQMLKTLRIGQKRLKSFRLTGLTSRI